MPDALRTLRAHLVKVVLMFFAGSHYLSRSRFSATDPAMAATSPRSPFPCAETPAG